MEPSQLRARAAVGATGHSCMQPRRSAPRQSAKVPTALSITEVANPWTCAAASSLMAARIGGGSSSSRCRVDTSAALGDAITVSASPTHARLRNRPPQVKLDPETKAKHNRPPGWQAPGPQPVGAGSDPSLEPQENETLSYLTGDWRIFQLKNGHRQACVYCTGTQVIAQLHRFSGEHRFNSQVPNTATGTSPLPVCKLLLIRRVSLLHSCTCVPASTHHPMKQRASVALTGRGSFHLLQCALSLRPALSLSLSLSLILSLLL